jgi:hypothetical protein
VSTKKQTNIDIASRLQELVDEYAGGNAKLFAKQAGIVSVTFYNYLKGRQPNAEALANICITYKVNLNWLVTGTGSEKITFEGEDSQKQPVSPHSEAVPFDSLGIVEGMSLLTKIYSAADPVYIRAINANLMAFSDAVESKTVAREMETRVKGMEKDLAEMKSYVLEMKRQEEERDRLSKEAPSSAQKAA